MDDHDEAMKQTQLPKEPIHRLTEPLNRLMHVEAAGGAVLLVCALGALGAANSEYAERFLEVWKFKVGFSWGDFHLLHPLKHWINDGLMAIFFFVVGLEVKREIVLGDLGELRRAALPLGAAIGGMVVPAGIFLLMQTGEPGERGWGIPMATDIAFVVGCMAILGRRVPASLRIILLTLAIVDDIGAILVIAFGYTESLNWEWLITGAIGIGVVVLMQRLGIRSMGLYTLSGAIIWLGFHESGIHATIAGVVLGLMTPARPYLDEGVGGQMLQRASEVVHSGSWDQDPKRAAKISQFRRLTRETISPLEYLIYMLHPWVVFLIMPIFALANAGIAFQMADVISPISLAVILGLSIGKPVGILLFSWLLVRFGLAQLPPDVRWRHLAGGGFLAGIGFTMALFIAGLAFADESLLRSAKMGVLVGSLVSAIAGMLILGTTAVPSKT